MAASRGSAGLHLGALHWCGFDMDHTLVRYRLPAVFDLIFTSITRFLVEKKGYPEAVRDLKPDPSNCHKGLIFDSAHGNLLRLSRQGRVLGARHGSAWLTGDALSALYGADREAQCLSELAETLAQGRRCPAGRFHAFTTYFGLPGACVAARVVDTLDKSRRTEQPSDYTQIMPCVFEALDFNFHHEQFGLSQGYYFPEVQANPNQYISPCSGAVKRWLASMRAAGVKVFLLTNSHGDYTEHLMDFAFGRDWRDAFDLVIVKGQKPAFFTSTRADQPFMTLVNGCEAGPEGRLGVDKTLVHGNRDCLVQFFSDVAAAAEPSTGHAPPEPGTKPTTASTSASQPRTGSPTNPLKGLRVAYFGDHVIGDVMAVARHTDWQSIAVVEEVLVGRVPPLPSDGPAGPVHEADWEAAEFLRAADAWGSVYGDREHLWDAVFREHGHLVVPHLDSLAVLPVGHRFAHSKATGGGHHPHDYTRRAD